MKNVINATIGRPRFRSGQARPAALGCVSRRERMPEAQLAFVAGSTPEFQPANGS